MTTDVLIAELEARGVTLRERAGRLIIRPAKAITPQETELLRQAKPDVLAYLRGRAIGMDWSKVSLWSLDKILEIVVPWSDVRLVVAPGCRLARELRAQDPKPGRVWCVCEVLDLLLSGVTPADARKIGEAKLALDGNVTGVRQETGRTT